MKNNQMYTKKMWIVKIPVFIFIGAILFLSIFYINSKFHKIEKQNTTSQEVETTASKVFYSKENNIFSYDVDTKKVMNWTNFERNNDTSPTYDEHGKQIPSLEINNIKVVDDSTIGFGECKIIVGEFGCGIYTLDLETKEIIERKKLDKQMSILDLGFFSPNKFAYVGEINEKWQIFLFDNGILKTLEDVAFFDGYGRGGILEDSQKITFSKDGKHVLQISTHSARTMFEFNMYIYNLIDGSKQIISDATQPEWFDNETIIYRKYNKKGDGLYLYNINTKTQKKISGINDSAYKPMTLYSKNKIIYSVYLNKKIKQIWLYDFNTKKNSKILDNAFFGFWVTPTKIVYEEIEPYNNYNNKEAYGDFATEFTSKSVNVFDLENNMKTGSISDLKNTYNTASGF